MSKHKLATQLYISIIVVLALLLLFVSLQFRGNYSYDIGDVILLLLVSIITENFNVIFNKDAIVSATPVIHIATIFLLPPPLAALIALISITFQQIRERPIWYKAVFNIGHYIIITVLPAMLVQLGGEWTDIRQFNHQVMLFAGSLLVVLFYYLLDATSLNVVIALTSNRTFAQVWKANYGSTLLFDFTVPIIGVIAAIVWLHYALFCILLLLPIVVNQYAQTLISRLTQQNESLDTANHELAYKREIEQRLTQRVDDLTKQVSQAFTEQNRNLSDQIIAVIKVTNTTDELSQTNESIAKAARQVDDTAQTALSVVEDGTATVREGLKSLSLLSEQAQRIANAMDAVYKQARHIDQIIDLINEIAEETNLLALNATIEAAGAGEYGKRFAVVANEVQLLASRSRQATQQVRRVIEEVRNSIQNSSAVAQQGVNEAATAMSGNRATEQTLEGIVEMVQHTARLARQISIAIQQQRGATEQLVETVHQVSSISYSVAEDSKYLMGSFYTLDQAIAQRKAVAIE